MNKIVREHFPVDRLPQELREGFAPDARVTVTNEPEINLTEKMGLGELFALPRDVSASIDDIN